MISEYDKQHVDRILLGDGDWFGAKLLRLIADADIPNREKLRLAYPDYVEAYEKWFYKADYEAHIMES